MSNIINISSSNPLPISLGGTGNSTGNPSGLAGGDLSGSFPNPIVSKINTVPVISSTVSDGQILIGSTSASNYTASTLTGTANEVIVTNGSNSITLSTPQAIGTGSSPTFTGLTLSGLTASQAIVTNISNVLTSLHYSSSNTPTSLVERDGSGNFSAGTITATLSGTATNANNILTNSSSSNASFYLSFFASNSSTQQVPQLSNDFTVNPSNGILSANNVSIGGITTSNAPLTVAYNGSAAAGHIAYFGSLVAATTTNFYSVTIDKNGTDSLILGVNKDSSTGNIPANSTFITTNQSNGQISFGRGSANGQPSNFDLLIGSAGNVTVANNLTVNTLSSSNLVVTNGSNQLSSTNTLSSTILGNITKVTVTSLTSGSGTYTPPANCTHIKVRCWGGGGGGGGVANAALSFGAAGGGGGGAYVETIITSPSVGGYSYSIGTGGGGAPGGSGGGGNGNPTTFSTLTANGGVGGQGYTAGIVSGAAAGGGGGTASGGQLNAVGGDGGVALSVSTTSAMGGFGGLSPSGGGSIRGRAINGTLASNGFNGNFPGGGGSGGGTTTTTSTSGGNGSIGLILVEEYYNG